MRQLETRTIGPLQFLAPQVVEEYGFVAGGLTEPSVLIGQEISLGVHTYEVIACSLQGFDPKMEARLPFHTEDDGVVEILMPVSGAAELQTKSTDTDHPLTHILAVDRSKEELAEEIVANPDARYYFEIGPYGPPTLSVATAESAPPIKLQQRHFTAVISAGLIHHAVQITHENATRIGARWISLKLKKIQR